MFQRKTCERTPLYVSMSRMITIPTRSVFLIESDSTEAYTVSEEDM